MLGIGCNRRVTVHGATGGCRMRVDQIAATLGPHCWTRYSAGAGAKGPRFYQWAFIALHPTTDPGTAGCSCAATPTAASWPTTAATALDRSPQRPSDCDLVVARLCPRTWCTAQPLISGVAWGMRRPPTVILRARICCG